MTSISGANKNAILTALVNKVKEVSDFGNRVKKGYRITQKTFPAAIVHLVRDKYDAGSTNEEEHILHCRILIQKTADIKANAEVEMEAFIELVGLVEDKLNSVHYLASTWERLEIDEIIYNYGQSEGVLLYKGLMTVTIKNEW